MEKIHTTYRVQEADLKNGVNFLHYRESAW